MRLHPDQMFPPKLFLDCKRSETNLLDRAIDDIQTRRSLQRQPAVVELITLYGETVVLVVYRLTVGEIDITADESKFAL